MNKRVKPVKHCVKVRYLQGKGKQKALWTDEKIEITLRIGLSASKVRQYFKTDRGEAVIGVEANSCIMVCVWVCVLTLPNSRLSDDIMRHKYDHKLQRGHTPGISPCFNF